jgi:hypothetical protein
MRTTRLTLGIILLAACAPGATEPNTLTAQEKAAGWKLLFDGKSMAGWNDTRRMSPPGDAWTIEDGCLKAQPRPHITEDLVSVERFANFEFVFDWRISPGGNSGVKYRIQDLVWLVEGKYKRFEDMVDESIRRRRNERPEKGQQYVVGFEYQVIDNGRHRDALRGPKYQSAGLYDLVGPVKDVTRPVGEFNHSRIVLRGNHVEHWLNGEKVVDTDLGEAALGSAKRWGAASPVYDMLVKQPRKECPISLQNHNDAAWFRNIKIRRLD